MPDADHSAAQAPEPSGRPASKNDVPRAVEKLLQWGIRLACYCVALVFAAVGAVSTTRDWPWPIGAALFVVAVAAIGVGRVAGGPCPLVFRTRPDGKPDVLVRTTLPDKAP